jgi:DNA invertase Pin-like site-specific DNA recombinase
MKGGRSPRANGVKMGRKPILTPYQIKEARQRIAKGEKTREVAKVFNVSISTISRLADAR